MQQRTKEFALRVIRMVETLPRTDVARIIARQVLRAGTSVGANYRAACRARSRRDFVSKIGIVVEEADESLYWMELLVDATIIQKDRLERLMKEANELTAIFTASLKTSKKS